jgi:hypothetical protein
MVISTYWLPSITIESGLKLRKLATMKQKNVVKFFENEVIYRFGIPKHILIDNGREWAIEFDQLYKNYGMIHQHTKPQWPICNGVAIFLLRF